MAKRDRRNPIEAPLAEEESLPREHPLKAEFRKLGISQMRLARRLGVSQGLVSLYLNGWQPLPDNVRQILEAYLENLKGRKAKRRGREIDGEGRRLVSRKRDKDGRVVEEVWESIV
jgi:transcriptional regulator with XRE-family HTH domain